MEEVYEDELRELAKNFRDKVGIGEPPIKKYEKEEIRNALTEIREVFIYDGYECDFDMDAFERDACFLRVTSNSGTDRFAIKPNSLPQGLKGLELIRALFGQMESNKSSGIS